MVSTVKSKGSKKPIRKSSHKKASKKVVRKMSKRSKKTSKKVVRRMSGGAKRRKTTRRSHKSSRRSNKVNHKVIKKVHKMKGGQPGGQSDGRDRAGSTSSTSSTDSNSSVTEFLLPKNITGINDDKELVVPKNSLDSTEAVAKEVPKAKTVNDLLNIAQGMTSKIVGVPALIASLTKIVNNHPDVKKLGSTTVLKQEISKGSNGVGGPLYVSDCGGIRTKLIAILK